MEITTDRLVIRRFRPEDWQDIYEYLSDEEVVRYLPYEAYTSDRAREAAIKRAEQDIFYAVCLKETGNVIGELLFKKMEFETWELGYVFNPRYMGKGLAFESAKAFLDHAFREPGVRRIVALCNPDNERSWKLMERLSMRREGLLVKNIYFKTDEKGEPIWLDTLEYGLLKDEWYGNPQTEKQ